MKINKKIYHYFFLFLYTFFPLSGKEDYRIEDQPVALEEAKALLQQGVLKQKENGFVYLDVSNDFINFINPLLDLPGQLRPRPTAARSIGAHVSVFHEKENITPDELNASFSFSIKEIRSFILHTRDGLKKLWTVTLNSPDLENLREKYGCTPKLKGYDFHITLGKQMPIAPENWSKLEVLSPFNFSDEPTSGLYEKGDFTIVENEEILSTIAKVDAVGQLYIKSNGYVYLDVNNRFVEEVSSQLSLQNAFRPISTGPKKMGAHISVILEDEMISHEIWDLAEAGEWFTFQVKELRYVDRKTSTGKKRLWLLAVDSPALQRLRAHYGLKPKLKGHDFHITLGYEQVEVFQEEEITELEPAPAA